MIKRYFTSTVLTAMIIITAAMAPDAYAVCGEKMTTTSPYMYMPCPDDDPRWEQAFTHWRKRKNIKDVMAALSIFEDIAADNPDNTDVGAWLGWAYFIAASRHRSKREQYAEKGIAATNKVLAEDPDNMHAMNWKNANTVLIKDSTVVEYAEINAGYRKFYHLREIPVPTGDPMWAQAMKLWDTRLTAQDFEKVEARIEDGEALTDENMKHVQEKGKAVIAMFEKLEKKYPDRIEPKLWLSRSCYWMTQVTIDPKDISDWGKAGMEWGLKALEMEPLNAAGNNFHNLNTAEYSMNKSYAIVVKYSRQMGQELLWLIEEDPNYYYCAFSRYFAAAIALAPKLVFSVADFLGYPREIMERLTDFAANVHPDFLANHHYFARMKYAMGHKEEARKIAKNIVKADATLLKHQESENRLFQLFAINDLEHFYK